MPQDSEKHEPLRRDFDRRMVGFGALTVAGVAALFAGLVWLQSPIQKARAAGGAEPSAAGAIAVDVPKGMAVATFATGCFWCTESDFDKVKGVLSTTSGYTGGTEPNPTYRQVAGGFTSHTEAVQIVYDPKKVTFDHLLDHFWRTTDIFDLNGQFCDRGRQYRPEIFVHSETQKNKALASRQALNESGQFDQEIKVPITPASTFTPAEDYHQNFYKTNPWHYHRYRRGCGRDARLEQIWGAKPRS